MRIDSFHFSACMVDMQQVLMTFDDLHKIKSYEPQAKMALRILADQPAIVIHNFVSEKVQFCFH